MKYCFLFRHFIISLIIIYKSSSDTVNTVIYPMFYSLEFVFCLVLHLFFKLYVINVRIFFLHLRVIFIHFFTLGNKEVIFSSAYIAFSLFVNGIEFLRLLFIYKSLLMAALLFYFQVYFTSANDFNHYETQLLLKLYVTYTNTFSVGSGAFPANCSALWNDLLKNNDSSFIIPLKKCLKLISLINVKTLISSIKSHVANTHENKARDLLTIPHTNTSHYGSI